MAPLHAEQRTHDYRRYGTASLFAALNTATGEVIGLCHQRHRHQEFLKFLNKIHEAYPDQELHLVIDNYATHKHPAVRKWFDDHPYVTPHFTLTSAWASPGNVEASFKPPPSGWQRFSRTRQAAAIPLNYVSAGRCRSRDTRR
jgi:DDE superfamily endonuclease